MDDKRLVDIESKLAHQEQTVETLNLALTDQQARIADLEALCRSLLERLRSLSDGAPDADPNDERPPHY